MAEESGLSEKRRRELLAEVRRNSATIGKRIPETVNVDGEPFDLREFVMETKSQGSIPPDRREEVRRVRNTLKRERNRRLERLETASLTEPEAVELADTILGLERALTALSNLSESSFVDRSDQAELDGTRQWLDFLDQLTD
ncbi:MAG: DUF5788 family protein [Halodesulfurarchaeum sp.]